MTLRLVRTASGGWGRDGLITHITNDRPEETERCFLPVLEDLHGIDPDRRLEALSALSPWLARVTNGAFPVLVGGLEFPAPRMPSDRHLRERRMFAAGR